MMDPAACVDRRFRGWLVALATAGLFGLLAFLSIELTRGAGRIAAFWLPNAVMVALLLRVPDLRFRQVLPLCLLANIAANMAAGDAPLIAAGLGMANAIEIGVAVTLTLRLIGGSPSMSRMGDIVRLLLAACLVAPLCSGLFATFVLHPAGDGSLLADAAMWAATDALGMLLGAPILIIFLDALREPRKPTRSEIIDWAAIFVVGTATVVGVFSQTAYPLLFLAGNVVLLHAFRLGLLGTAVSVAKIAVIAIIATSLGSGPLTLIDGTLFEQLATLQLFLAAIFAMGVPVAAILERQRRTYRQLAKSEAHLRLLTDHAADAVIQIDRAGRVTYASPAFGALFGVDARAGEGRALSSLAHPADQERVAEFVVASCKKPADARHLTFRCASADGVCAVEHVEVSCTPVPGPDGGIVACARDVTRRVRLEDQLNRARRQAEDGTRAKSEFLANMSHEIRTPMNGVLGFAELLLQADLPRREHRHAELIVESGQSMMALLNDILDISKIEAGQVQIKADVIPLAELVATCCRMHGPGAEAKKLDLRWTLADDLPNLVMADPLRLRQILLNLVGNAVKFTQEGHVEIAVCRQDDRMRLSVTDTGPGIAADRLEAIFRPLEQADMSTTRDFGGTGLGLAISRNLAQLMDGDITASSTPGKGTRFVLDLPLKSAGRRSASAADEAKPAGRGYRTGARILLVEDHDLNQIMTREMLERLGQHVTLAADGLDAVRFAIGAREHGMPFDLVLMDLRMPRCDGFEATSRIREAGIAPDTLPIIALTANAFPEDMQAAKEAGMQHHLSKPLTIGALRETLGEWLPDHSRNKAEQPRPENNGSVATFSPANANPALAAKWEERRREALEAVSALLREGQLGDEEVDRVASLAHKLAGAAAMFGQPVLGECASALEMALRRSQDWGEVQDSARAMLAAA